MYIYIYIIGHIWYICNWLRSSIVQAGCMFACNCTPTVVTRIYWVRVKECHYLVSFHSVLPSLECTLPALNRNNCFPSDDFLDSNDCLIRGWWLECLQFHLVCQGMRVFVNFFKWFLDQKPYLYVQFFEKLKCQQQNVFLKFIPCFNAPCESAFFLGGLGLFG